MVSKEEQLQRAALYTVLKQHGFDKSDLSLPLTVIKDNYFSFSENPSSEFFIPSPIQESSTLCQYFRDYNLYLDVKSQQLLPPTDLVVGGGLRKNIQRVLKESNILSSDLSLSSSLKWSQKKKKPYIRLFNDKKEPKEQLSIFAKLISVQKKIEVYGVKDQSRIPYGNFSVNQISDFNGLPIYGITWQEAKKG